MQFLPNEFHFFKIINFFLTLNFFYFFNFLDPIVDIKS